MDQDRKHLKEAKASSAKPNEKNSEMKDAVDLPASLEELYRKVTPEMRRPQPTEDAMAAAMEVVQRLAAEAEAENPLHMMGEAADESAALVCAVCGYHNRDDSKFCGMCGLSLVKAAAGQKREQTKTLRPTRMKPVPMSEERSFEREAGPERHGPVVAETHHYHHHYHHHYFQGGAQAADEGIVRPMPEVARDTEKLRSSAILRGEAMSRAEAAVRMVTQEWVMACNTKHLDDLLELYIPDALVLRSNYPVIRGAAAIREFFFGALDAGLGEVELDPIRVEVAGDMAYEAGKCKALVPGVGGRRREERGKYLWVFARQSGGEWKLASDSWSSDLSLGEMELAPAAAKTNAGKK